jgi:hypothetical protein
VSSLPKWVWSKGRDGLGVMPMHLPSNVLD